MRNKQNWRPTKHIERYSQLEVVSLTNNEKQGETNTWETHALMPLRIYAWCMYVEADPFTNLQHYSVVHTQTTAPFMFMVLILSFLLILISCPVEPLNQLETFIYIYLGRFS